MSKLRTILLSTLFFGAAMGTQTLKADQTEAAALSVFRLPEGAWVSGVQVNQLTFNETEAKHKGHDRGNVGISQSSINARFAQGGTDIDPETALYVSLNRYKLYGHRGEDIEPVAHYLPFLAIGGVYDSEKMFRLNYLLGVQFNWHHWNLATSTRYVGMLAGRSPISCDPCGAGFGIDYGVYVLTGTRRTQAYPILGFDYESGKWKFKAIYPLEISLRHQTTQDLMLIATTRWNNDRFRLSHSADRKDGYMQYQNYGLEVGLEWKFLNRWKLGLAVGENLIARLDTYNHMGKGHKHYKLNPVLYSQINVSCAL